MCGFDDYFGVWRGMVSVLSRGVCGVILSVNGLCFVKLHDAFVSCTNLCSCFVDVVIFFTFILDGGGAF